jgi:hypothetical protein
MPARPVRAGDVTGQIHKRLSAMAKRQTAQQWNDYQDKLKSVKEEIDAAKRVYPVAIENYDPDEVIDYTGSYRGYDPDNKSIN